MQPLEQLKTLMVSHRLTGRVLARRLGFSEPYVSDVLNQRRRISVEFALKCEREFDEENLAINLLTAQVAGDVEAERSAARREAGRKGAQRRWGKHGA